MMYLRFRVDDVDTVSGKHKGVITAIHDLIEDDALTPGEARSARQILDWFDEHLAEPTRFSRSRKYHAARVAISWFKDSAHAPITAMRALVAILENKGIRVTMVRTSDPGYIVYEDRYQVVTQPHRHTPT